MMPALANVGRENLILRVGGVGLRKHLEDLGFTGRTATVVAAMS